MGLKRKGMLGVIFSLAALLLAGCASLRAAVPANGEVRIVMRDFTFEPDAIRVRAGQTVTFVLVNEGDKMHEFMIGRDVEVHEGATEGFAVDFFRGITPEVSGPGMVMDMGSEMEMEGMGEENQSVMQTPIGDMEMQKPTGMPGMGTVTPAPGRMMPGPATMQPGMGDMQDATPEPGRMAPSGASGGVMETPSGEFGSFQMPLMEAHAGFMVMLDPIQQIPSGRATRLTFTIPEDRVGRWMIGCFQESGQHFDDGMRAFLIVEPD